MTAADASTEPSQVGRATRSRRPATSSPPGDGVLGVAGANSAARVDSRVVVPIAASRRTGMQVCWGSRGFPPGLGHEKAPGGSGLSGGCGFGHEKAPGLWALRGCGLSALVCRSRGMALPREALGPPLELHGFSADERR